MSSEPRSANSSSIHVSVASCDIATLTLTAVRTQNSTRAQRRDCCTVTMSSRRWRCFKVVLSPRCRAWGLLLRTLNLTTLTLNPKPTPIKKPTAFFAHTARLAAAGGRLVRLRLHDLNLDGRPAGAGAGPLAPRGRAAGPRRALPLARALQDGLPRVDHEPAELAARTMSATGSKPQPGSVTIALRCEGSEASR